MKFKSLTKTVFYGLCLGTSLLPPGFSVATMAMILGIYEELIDLVNHLFSRNMKRTLKTVLALVLGAVAAIFLFSRVITFAFSTYPYQTTFFFLGLIVATVPLIFKQSGAKSEFEFKHWIVVLIAFLFILSFILENNMNLIDLEYTLSLTGILFLVVAGMLVAISMLLPGLSGALILILLGIYHFLLESVASLNLIVLGSVLVGGVLGLVMGGRLIKFLLTRHEKVVNAISMGLVMGSIPVFWFREGRMPTGIVDILLSLVVMLIGFAIVYSLNKRTY